MPDETIPAWILTTQLSLGKLVSHPTLTSNVLLRPPFRFIRDIVFEVYGLTGFPQLLSEKAESDMINDCQDKSTKTRFLEGLIHSVETELGCGPIDISTSKILAGLEPEKTNHLLVSLHDAAQHYLASHKKACDRETPNTDPRHPSFATDGRGRSWVRWSFIRVRYVPRDCKRDQRPLCIFVELYYS